MNSLKKVSGLIVFTSIWIAGCHFRPFQPPPDMYEYWSKDETSTFEIKKAMLECGFPGVYEWPGWATNDKDKDALMYRCMESSGFTYLGDQDSFCDGWYEDTMPVTCSKNIPVPKRNISKRTNSEFCHRYPSADICN